jgi:hypothetical protein
VEAPHAAAPEEVGRQLASDPDRGLSDAEAERRLARVGQLFLVVGWSGKVVITGIVFLIDPSWFQGAAQVHWPEPTFRNFVAVALLALLAFRPHARAHDARRLERGARIPGRRRSAGRRRVTTLHPGSLSRQRSPT